MVLDTLNELLIDKQANFEGQDIFHYFGLYSDWSGNAWRVTWKLCGENFVRLAYDACRKG